MSRGNPQLGTTEGFVTFTTPPRASRGETILNGTQRLEWYNKDAADYFAAIANRLGAPSAVDPTPGGLVIWKKDKLMNLPFDRVEIKDESIPHLVPEPHTVFVSVSVTLDINPSKFMEVLSVSGTLSYDQLSKRLTCKSGSLEACVALLALATQVASGHLSLAYVQQNDLVSQYVLGCGDQYARLLDLLAYNLKHQPGDPYPDGYSPLSTPGVGHPSPYNLRNF